MNLIAPSSGYIPSYSQTVTFGLESSEMLQDWNIFINDINIKQQSTIYKYRYDSSKELCYDYVIMFNVEQNNSGSNKTLNWKLDLDFITDTFNYSGQLIKYYNRRASYINNIEVYDKNNNLLQKDIYNRWTLGDNYNDDIYIKFNSFYYGEPNKRPQASVVGILGTSFVDLITPESQNTIKVKIGSFQSGDNAVQLMINFDDVDGSGEATSYIVLASKSYTKPIITIPTYSYLNINYTASTLNIPFSAYNIQKSSINIKNELYWCTPSINQNLYRLDVSIDANEGIGSEYRSGTISIYGTNDDGFYDEASVLISQIANVIPYIGGAPEEYIGLDGAIYPTIQTNYNGELKAGSEYLTLFNSKDTSYNSVISSISFEVDDEPTTFVKVEDIPNTRNSKLVFDSKFKTNYSQNDLYTPISVYITLTNGQEIYYDIIVHVDASPEHIIGAIWQDIYYECNAKYFRFKNILTNEILYNGIIYPQASNKIKINDILSSYILLNKYPFEKTNINNKSIEVVLEISDDVSFNISEEVKIYHLFWDYSYDYNIDYNKEYITPMSIFTTGYYGEHSGIDITANFTNPIQYYDPRQLLFINYGQIYENYNKTEIDIYGLKYNEDTEEDENVIIETIPVNKFKGDMLTATIRVQPYKEITTIVNALPDEDPDKQYYWKCGYSKCTKANYAVYYLNSYGIWCWMLFEGKQMESTKTTLNKYMNNNSNRISHNIHTAIYQNLVEDSYSLTSNYLTDIQSEKLKDLYSSPLIYIHDLEKDNIFNVYLSTTTYDIKTYYNQGRKRFTHTIKLTKSLNKSIQI